MNENHQRITLLATSISYVLVILDTAMPLAMTGALYVEYQEPIINPLLALGPRFTRGRR